MEGQRWEAVGPAQAGEMMSLLFGAWAARLVHTAAELGIADHLASGPGGSKCLAKQIGAHAPSLSRLLRALTAIGVLQESPDRLYTLTPLGATLRRAVSRSW
jgi:DNA-binding HxlR family transcriptional regulator